MKASQPATILIVDAQVLFRAGLRAMLAVDARLSVVGEADDGESALTAVMTAAPDIVLIDANLAMRGGLEVAAQIRRVVSTAAIIVLTDQVAPRGPDPRMRKLSVNDRTQAVVYAIRKGWIEMPPAS